MATESSDKIQKQRILKIALYVVAGFVGLFVVYAAANYLYYRDKSPVKVVSIQPLGEVDRKSNFTIEFSRDMVGGEKVNISMDTMAVNLKPLIPGRFKWISRRRLRFFPDELLRPSTEYTIEILPEICTHENAYLAGQTEFNFYTERFRVMDTHHDFVFEDRRHRRARLEVNVEFNYPVEPEKLQDHLYLFYGKRAFGSTITYTIETTQPRRIIKLLSSPLKKRDEEQVISVKIAKGLKCQSCGLGLLEEFEKRFKLRSKEELKLMGVYPQQTGRACWITIRFSTPVDAKVVKEYLTVKPKIDYRIEERGRYLYLKGQFKPGQLYTVTLKKGLPAKNISRLPKDLTNRVRLRNLEPTVSFVDKGIYLPLKGNKLVGVETVNVRKMEIEITKIFENNLTYFLNQGRHYYGEYYPDEEYRHYGYSSGARYLGKRIHREEIEIDAEMNEPVTVPIDMSKFLSDKRKGIFRVVVRDTENRWRKDSKWIMATDMGILAHKAEDELVVWVNSLSTLAPYSNARVTLISRTNQTLLNGTTNAEGVVSFKNLRRSLEDFEPFVITVTHDEDLSYLKFSDCEMSTSDFDVDGRPHLVDGYEAFVYVDRGVFRPGDTVNLVGVIRGKKVTLPQTFPVKLQVRAPDDQVFKELRGNISAGGACGFKLFIPEYARTGKYLAKLIITKDQEIGRTSFSVEEFVPDRIKVEVKTDKTSYRTGETALVDVKGINLFGPPAAGRKVEGQCEIQAYPFNPPQWRSYTFGHQERTFQKMEIKFGEAKLDDQGKHQFSFRIPDNIKPPSALRDIVSVTVTEPGGRAVSVYTGIDIHPYPFYIGLRRQSKGHAELGKEVAIDYVVVDSEGKESKAEVLQATIYKVIWHSILKKDNRGLYRYVSEKSNQVVTSYPVSPAAFQGTIHFTPEEYGQYRIELSDPKSDAISSISFYATGWGYAPWSMAHPDRLEIELDKKSYQPGETAKVLIKAPFSGKLILCVEREQVYSYRMLEMKENTANIEIPVTRNYKPNVYVTASLIRSVKSLEKHAPVRAFGTAPLMVNCKANYLTVKLDTPTEMRPKKILEVKVAVSGNVRDAYITIAAVDEGICQLTDFKTPDPFNFFYGKKKLNVSSYDLYTYILPELEIAFTSSSPAGGRLEGVHKRHLMPVDVKRIKPVSLWSGIVRLGRNGKGKVRFEVPEFNGSLRLMAVSFDGSNFGFATKNVTVREPIVLTPTFPRFISSSDKFQVPVSVFNGCGKSGQFSISLKAEGAVEILGSATKFLNISNKQEKIAFFQIQAKEGMGKVFFTVSAKGAGATAQTTTDLALRPPAPPVTKTGSVVITLDKSVVLQLPSDWIAGTESYQLITSAFPAVKFATSLQYLLRYPYGCIEQTTSRCFPLLYFDDLARLAEPELFKTNSAEYYVEEGIARLEAMLLPSGAFAFWPRSTREIPWGSIYASHFLVEAKKAGYSVSRRVYSRVLSNLRKVARSQHEDDYHLADRVYALYVLAAAGRPDRSSMIYLKNNKLKVMSAATKFQLAGAFGLVGDRRTAESLLPTQVQPQTVPRETGGHFDSSIRTNAIILDVLTELLPQNPSIPVLVNALSDAAETGRWYTTQENAFAFLALGKVLKKKGEDKFTGEIKLNGKGFSKFGTENQVITDRRLGGKQIAMQIKGKGTCYFYWQASGIPRGVDIEESDKGLKVRRVFLDRDGNPINYQQIKQGELIVARISMTALDKRLENVIVADLLPAGLEIENPRLESRADVPWIQEKSYQPDYMDIRDDRLLLFLSLPERKEQTFYYALRAVTVGDFTLPPIKAECMYDPVYTSVSSSGVIKVVVMEVE